jgi:thiol:disulfide interchange protein DsbD
MSGRMSIITFLTIFFISFIPTVSPALGGSEPVEVARFEQEYSTAHLEPAMMEDKAALAVVFEGTDDLHFYAKEETAPGGYKLRIEAKSAGISFGEAVFPKWGTFRDPALKKDVEVYVGKFDVFVPIESEFSKTPQAEVEVKISGIACTSRICLRPFEHKLETKIDFSQADSWRRIKFSTAPAQDAKPATPKAAGRAKPAASYSAPIAFLIALVAGLLLNVMPCVWPVIPIIVMRIWNQAGESKSRSIGLGLAFCGGILLFFAAIAVLNIVLILGFDTVFQWGDLLRNTVFLAAMTLLMVVLALFMFGVFAIGIPASVTSKAGAGSGYAGSVGMGFLAALLATPCSFAILAAAVAWAQTQTLGVATFTLMLIGVGMAAPYLVLILTPGLLNRLPKPGGWMERIKQGLGFLLLLIAVKLLGALPGQWRISVLYYVVILSFCVWMWGGWVSYATARGRKWLVRSIALLLAVAAGWAILPAHEKAIDWLDYDAGQIAIAASENKPVLIKFTADWCSSCSIVEKFVYMRKDIAELIKQKGILPFKGDTTLTGAPATIDLAKVYNEPGVPVSVLLLPDGRTEKLRGLIGKNDLKKFLNTLPDAKR